MIVVIDDERTFADEVVGQGEEVVYLRTSQEALVWFSKYITEWLSQPSGSLPQISEVWFDHDLGEKSDDDAVIVARFLDCMIWKLNDEPIFEILDVYVHSQNPVGAQNIANAFRYGRTGVDGIMPLPPLKVA